MKKCSSWGLALGETYPQTVSRLIKITVYFKRNSNRKSCMVGGKVRRPDGDIKQPGRRCAQTDLPSLYLRNSCTVFMHKIFQKKQRTEI